MEPVEKIAEAVLYEGYLLFPYRRSAMKNQQRWTFGGVYPRPYSEATGGDEPCLMQTQCLLIGDADTEIEGKIRFLHVVERKVAEKRDGALRFVEELRVESQVYRPWEEAIEREISLGSLRLGDLIAPLLDKERGWGEVSAPLLDKERGWGEVVPPLSLIRRGAGGEVTSRRFDILIPEGSAEEPLRDADGNEAGALVREWRPLQGEIEVAAEPLTKAGEAGTSGESGYRLTVRIVNTIPWSEFGNDARTRSRVTRHAFISTHTILRVQKGEFVSLLEPPDAYREAAEGCENIKTWPVLVGEPGERHTILSSPIILYDYPQISPESQGNYFDATEIDELLALSVMTLTDAEKQEMRESDVHAREILERTESLSEEQLSRLHGAIRSLQPMRRDES